MAKTLTLSLAGVLALISLAARADEWSAPATPVIPGAATTSQWLTTNSRNDQYIGLGGLSGFAQGSRTESAVKLDTGWTAGFFSSSYSAPGAASAADPLGRWRPGAPNALDLGVGNGFTTAFNGTQGSSFGGHMSKDLGGGLSVNLVGGMTRDTSNALYPGARSPWAMNGTDVSATVGGGMSMDFGGGSSLSVGATMTKGSNRCAGQLAGFCR